MAPKSWPSGSWMTEPAYAPIWAAALTAAPAYSGTDWASGATAGALPVAMWMQKLSSHGCEPPEDIP